jgi:hypothetical protein
VVMLLVLELLSLPRRMLRSFLLARELLSILLTDTLRLTLRLVRLLRLLNKGVDEDDEEVDDIKINMYITYSVGKAWALISLQLVYWKFCICLSSDTYPAAEISKKVMTIRQTPVTTAGDGDGLFQKVPVTFKIRAEYCLS